MADLLEEAQRLDALAESDRSTGNWYTPEVFAEAESMLIAARKRVIE
jgi:hypothetical protein